MTQQEIIKQLVEAIQKREMPADSLMKSAIKIANKPAGKKRPKKLKISQLTTILRRFGAPGYSVPTLNCVHFTTDTITVTNPDVWAVLDIGLPPDNMEFSVPFKDMKRLGKLLVDSPGKWTLDTHYVIDEVHTPEKEIRPNKALDYESAAIKWVEDNYPDATRHKITQRDTLKITTDSGAKISIPCEENLPPQLPELGDHSWVGVATLADLERIAQIGIFAATDESRPVFQAVNVKISPDSPCKITAADGYRLIEDTSLDFAADSKIEFNIPAKTIQDITKSLKTLGQDKAVLRLYDKHLEIVTKKTRFIVQLIEGDFPDTNRVIPFESIADTTFIVCPNSTSKAAQAIVDANPETKKQGAVWDLALDSPEGNVSDYSGNRIVWETSNVSPGVDVDKPVTKMCYNPQYVKDAMACLTGEVEGRYHTATGPIKFSTDSCMVLIMPMHEPEPEHRTVEVNG